MRGLLVCLVVLATLCACADAKGRLFEKPIAFPDQLVGRPRRVSIESLMGVLVVQLLRVQLVMPVCLGRLCNICTLCSSYSSDQGLCNAPWTSSCALLQNAISTLAQLAPWLFACLEASA
jgi:hypothetical protein